MITGTVIFDIMVVNVRFRFYLIYDVINEDVVTIEVNFSRTF